MKISLSLPADPRQTEIVVDGQDLTRAVSGVAFTAGNGEMAALHIDFRKGIPLELEAEVERITGLSGEPTAREFLDEVDPQALEEAMADGDFDTTVGEAALKALRGMLGD